MIIAALFTIAKVQDKLCQLTVERIKKKILYIYMNIICKILYVYMNIIHP